MVLVSFIIICVVNKKKKKEKTEIQFLSNIVFFYITIDYCQDSWCSGRDSPLHSCNNPLASQQNNSIPMPTLYSTEGHRKLKPSITELVMYNMASMLASVATGYDVRMSNVSPVHPKLQPQMTPGSECSNDSSVDDLSGSRCNEFGSNDQRSSNYMHNTYHGPTKHIR